MKIDLKSKLATKYLILVDLMETKVGHHVHEFYLVLIRPNALLHGSHIRDIFIFIIHLCFDLDICIVVSKLIRHRLILVYFD